MWTWQRISRIATRSFGPRRRRIAAALVAVSAVLLTGSALHPTTAYAEPTPLIYRDRVVDGHRLLAYDVAGGRVAEVFGDLDRAERVAVVVPGTGHSLDNFFGNTRPGAPWQNARAVHAELGRRAPDTPVAVIAWAGYDSPASVNLDAARSERARPGGRDLARLVRVIKDRNARAHVSLLCHSYGSVACGYAAPVAGFDAADDMVALGSPGMDVPTASDLDTDARVWAARTADDPIRFAPNVRIAGLGHDTNPASPEFGARLVGTGDARGHDDYYRGTSLANLARIVLGRDARVSTPDGGLPNENTTPDETSTDIEEKL